MNTTLPTPPPRASTRLRALLKEGKTLFVPGCYNAMSARVLDKVGFPAIYMSGYGTSLSMIGMPDAGLITMNEMQQNARYIANAVSVPVIADADNGFGNAINAMRCVREYIQTGVAGIHIEDQVAPKRCGHVAGREVIALAEAVGKIRSAHATRLEHDPDFLIIARSDARGAHGGSLSEAIDRVNRYLEAGADMAFVEGPTSLEEVETVCREVRGPVFYNMTGVSPRMSLETMQQLGIAITITAGTTMRATLAAVYDIAVKLRDEGPMAEAAFVESFKKHPLNDVHTFAGFDAIRAAEEAFLPAEHLEKYVDSIGHQPQQHKART
jgi:2-methylisocitrate lyase-like PEP mutase family enzyme